MSDLFLGQTCTELYKFISAGTAHTFSFNFQPDKVVFNNLTQWIATDTDLPISIWFRGQTPDDYAYQQESINAGGAAYNFKTITTNGFTVADTLGGVSQRHASISGITAADPAVVTHSAYTFQDDQLVRLTDLGNVGIQDNGMGPLNNNRFRITVLSPTTFSLRDPITGEPIDSTSFPAYVTGGSICLETAVISLNNPQVYPYAITPYVPNPIVYAPVVFQLLAGTGIMGADGDVFNIEVYKFGQVIDLGDLLV